MLIAGSGFDASSISNISSVRVWNTELAITDVLGKDGACGDPSTFVAQKWFRSLVDDAEKRFPYN